MTLRSRLRTLRLIIRLLVLASVGRLMRWAGRRPTALLIAALLPAAMLGSPGCLSPAPDTPLGRAAAAGETAEVIRLLSTGEDPGVPTGFGLTPLILAVRGGHAGTVSALIAAGADVNGFDAPPTREPWSPLMNAAHKRQPEIVRILLEARADPSLANVEGDTPLMMAAGEGELEIVRMLLDAGAPPDHASNAGATALENAVACGSTAVVRELLSRQPGLELPGSLRSGVARALARLRGRGEILSLMDEAATKGAPAVAEGAPAGVAQ